MVWPTSCDGVAIGQGMVGRNCGQVNRSTAEEHKALGRCIESAGHRRAIEIDSDYELAYNSLALTQRTSGELDKALYNYDAGAKALARRIVKAMRNSRSNPILKIAKRLGNYGSNMQAMPGCIWVAVQKASNALLG